MFDLNKPRLTAKGNKYELTVSLETLLFGYEPPYARLYARLQELENAIESGELAPVVHGEWIEVAKNDVACSACGNGVGFYSRFCPNCGAKMDLQEEK